MMAHCLSDRTGILPVLPPEGSAHRRRYHRDMNPHLRIAITGGTSGLGLALVSELVRRGADVAFVARTRVRVEEVRRAFPGTVGLVGDVSSKEDIYPIALQI